MQDKLEAFMCRSLTVAGFIILVAVIVGIGSCARKDYNREAACIAVGGRLVRVEGTSSGRGCYSLDATYTPIDSVENYRR